MLKKIFRVLILVGVISFTPLFVSSLYSQENAEVDDEFGEFKSFEEEETDDEFGEFKEFDEGSVDDEFSEFNEVKHSNQDCSKTCPHLNKRKQNKKIGLYWIIGVLIFTIIAGVLVRYKTTRNLRVLFLLISLFVLGFYKGGCTVCPIGGFQDFLLVIFGYKTGWIYILWFIAIIPITYFFGKVWCGWICHLGAIQEFLYLPRKIKILQTRKAQNIFRIIRYVLLGALIIQVAIMGTKYWCRIDPFINIFGFKGFYDMLINVTYFDLELIIIITLVVFVLISSLFIYRPFCRTMCPVGLVLGLITKIPGASVIGIKGECISCKMCEKSCEYKAIVRDEKLSIINNTDCIACGDCIDSCSQGSFKFLRKSKKYPTIVKCVNECKIEK